MKTLQLSLLLFGSVMLLLSSQCKKSDSSPPLTELQKLPAITQGGRNTFGCLINGKAFVPGGGGILANTLSVYYDPTFQGGKLVIKAINYSNNNSVRLEIAADSIRTAGTYPLLLHSKYGVLYDNSLTGCFAQTLTGPPNPISGSLNITRLDTIARVYSGIFEFKVPATGCADTITATYGRFDLQF
jgi:hypothetical protein